MYCFEVCTTCIRVCKAEQDRGIPTTAPPRASVFFPCGQTREATRQARKMFLVSLVFSLPLLVVSMGFRSKEKGGLSEGERVACMLSPLLTPGYRLRKE